MITWAKIVTAFRRVALIPPTIIKFDCRGCMAHDWREVDRGVIVKRYTQHGVYGAGFGGVEMILARRPDGSTFECFAQDCMPGEAYMQVHTDNPEEDLTDKWVYLR